MNKILICGETCSGKTSLGFELSSKLKIQSYDLDEINWLPNWNISSDEIFNKKLNQIVQKKQWIVSGNYFSRQNLIIQNCDTIIYLKIGFFTRLYRAFTRGIAELLQSYCKSYCIAITRAITRAITELLQELLLFKDPKRLN